MTPPEVVSRVDRRYPMPARMVRSENIVVVEAIVGADGAVSDVRLLRGVSKVLDEAAVEAVRPWRFRPARLNGRPVPSYQIVTVRFNLRR